MYSTVFIARYEYESGKYLIYSLFSIGLLVLRPTFRISMHAYYAIYHVYILNLNYICVMGIVQHTKIHLCDVDECLCTYIFSRNWLSIVYDIT